MSELEQRYLVQLYYYDISEYVKVNVIMSQQGQDVSRRNNKAWLMYNYLDFISKYNVDNSDMNITSEDGANAMITHMNQILNKQYNYRFQS